MQIFQQCKQWPYDGYVFLEFFELTCVLDIIDNLACLFFTVFRIYCPSNLNSFLNAAVLQRTCISYSITHCGLWYMQISCSALNAPADNSDGEQQKMEEPTSTRVADKVPAICPLTFPFFLFTLFFLFFLLKCTIFNLDNLNNGDFLFKRNFSLTNELVKRSWSCFPKNDYDGKRQANDNKRQTD